MMYLQYIPPTKMISYIIQNNISTICTLSFIPVGITHFTSSTLYQRYDTPLNHHSGRVRHVQGWQVHHEYLVSSPWAMALVTSGGPIYYNTLEGDILGIPHDFFQDWHSDTSHFYTYFIETNNYTKKVESPSAPQHGKHN